MTQTAYITDNKTRKELLLNRYIIEAIKIMALLNQDRIVIKKFMERNAKRSRTVNGTMKVGDVLVTAARLDNGNWLILRMDLPNASSATAATNAAAAQSATLSGKAASVIAHGVP